MHSSKKRMTKNRLCLIAAAAIVVSVIAACFMASGPEDSVAANPTSGDCGADLHWEIDTETGHLTITGTGAMDNYDPSDTRWGGYTVRSVTFPEGMTAIGAYAFSYCTQLTSVTIPNNVTTIRVNAFYGCSGLTEVTIGTGVTDILMNAFQGCSSLTSLTLPDNVATLGDNAFDNCSNLATVSIGTGLTTMDTVVFEGCNKLVSFTVADANTAYSSDDGVLFNKAGTTLLKYPAMKAGDTYTIPASVSTIGPYAFTKSANLTSITVPGTVGTIKFNAFDRCLALTSITMETGVTSIENQAFYNCSNLAEISLPDGLTSIESLTFYGCVSLTDVVIPDSLTTIKSNAFEGCMGITTITIPDDVTIIGSNAFTGCTGLTSVTLGSSVVEVNYGAFYGCTGLTTIALPDSVSSIGYNIFENCSNLTTINIGTGLTTFDDMVVHGCNNLQTINVAGGNATFSSVDGVLLNKAGTELLIYPVSKPDTSYTIPSTVSTIGDETFYRCSNLVSVTVPDSVTSIGDYAFEDCSNLTDVTIGTGLTTMGAYVFAGCDKFESISVAEGNAAFKSIDDVMFNKTGTELLIYPVCKPDSSYTIPDGVTSIRNCTFEYCYNLTAVTIPDSVTSIGNYAFHGIPLTSIAIPDGVTTIGEYAFSYCQDLTTATLGSGVEEIGECAFTDCEKLTSIIIPDSVTTIGEYAFANCSNLATVTLGSGLTSIEERTFRGCSKLTSIAIPDGVANIDGYAFANCFSLATVTLGSGVVSISDTAFEDCGNITFITVSADNPSYLSVDGVLFNKTGTVLIMYPANKSGDTYTIPAAVESIGSGAFRNSKIRTITIPDTVTSIGYGAFSGSSLTNVTLGSGITSISDYTFSSCDGLRSVNIPDTVTEIGDYAFAYISGLISITIPNTVTKIGNSAFYYCTGLNSVVIPDSVTVMENDAFMQCSGLTSVMIGSGVTEIPDGAFYSCEKLTSVAIPNNVTRIGDEAFAVCSSLATVSIGTGVTYVYPNAFTGCEKLASFTVADANTAYKSVDGVLFNKAGTVLLKYPAAKTGTEYTVPETVTTLGEDSFRYSGLVSITIGKDVSTLTYYAFYECSKLESFTVADANTEYSSVDGVLFNKDRTQLIIFPANKSASLYNVPDTVTDIGENAFRKCSRLVSVAIPAGVTNINDYAFDECKSLKSFTVADANTEYSSADGVLFNEDRTTLIMYPAKKAETTYAMPNTVKYVEDGAFRGCTNIKTLTISDNLASIDEYLLDSCTGLVTVNIGKSVTYIDTSAFDRLWNLEAINVPESNTKYSSADGVLFTKDKTALIKYPEAKKMASYSVPETVTSLSGSSFSGNWTIESITLPAGVKTIRGYAFEMTPNLKSFTVSGSNAVFNSADGVLRYKNGGGLVWCPSKWSGTLVVDDGISSSLLNTDLSLCDGITGFQIKEGSSFYSVKGSVLYCGNEIVGYASGSEATSLSIGASDSYVDTPFIYDAENLTEITVDPENRFFSSTEGSMYRKGGETLVTCPSGKTAFVFPAAVKSVRMMAFTGDKLTEITFVKDMKVGVEQMALYNCGSLNKIVIQEGADVTFEKDSILFDDTLEHVIYVVAPEGYTLDTSGFRSNVKIVYGEPPVPPEPPTPSDEEGNGLVIGAVVGTAVAVIAILGVAVFFMRKY